MVKIIEMICLMLVIFLLINSTGIAKIIQNNFSQDENITETTIKELLFILPEKGGGMAHSDPRMSDYIDMPIPQENVNIVWHKCDVPGEFGGSKGLGFSSNGQIAAATYSGLSNNLIIYDYDGNIIWKSEGLLNTMACASAPMIDIYGRVIACDNKIVIMVDPFDVDSDGEILEWKSELIEGGLPISPTITSDQTLIIATTGGPIYAFNIQNGSLLSFKYLTNEENSEISDGYYETINTPSVNGNRVYISTQLNKDNNPANRRGRFYALDINVNSSEAIDLIKTAWYYEFDGPSGASPLLIGDTLYFDGNKSLRKKPFTMALTDKGDYPILKWKKYIPYPIDSSLAQDPRGGFWIVDAVGGKLIHQSEKDGGFIEIIDTDEIIQEYGIHKPCSVITICGCKERPILITSALALDLIRSSCYVIAVDLANNNALLWKVKIFEGPISSVDFPFGQYPVMIRDDKPRIVFTTIRYGAWAIGSEINENSAQEKTNPFKSMIYKREINQFYSKIYERINNLMENKILSSFLK